MDGGHKWEEVESERERECNIDDVFLIKIEYITS
jgi:hypothetical protein